MPRLQVMHLPLHAQQTVSATAEPGDSLLVDTCLRRVWIGTTGLPGAKPSGAEIYRDGAAYQFLLEFVSGLHSAIPGETNVLGQFRQTWFRWRERHPATAGRLKDTVASLLQDARRIRSRHLQGIGGASYGSLVRRMIRPGNGDRVLLVGAGELSRSLWPFFRHSDTGLWNHRSQTADLPEWLRRFAPQAGEEAARWAQHVILTTPPDPTNDHRWRMWLESARPVSVIHLGHRRPGSYVISSAARCHCLDELFALRRSQDNVRSLQIEHARNACAEKAAERYAGRYPSAQRARA